MYGGGGAFACVSTCKFNESLGDPCSQISNYENELKVMESIVGN